LETYYKKDAFQLTFVPCTIHIFTPNKVSHKPKLFNLFCRIAMDLRVLPPFPPVTQMKEPIRLKIIKRLGPKVQSEPGLELDRWN